MPVSGVPFTAHDNTVSEFVVQFFEDSVSIDGTILPLGQISTEVLNIMPEELDDLHLKTVTLINAAKDLFREETKKDRALLSRIQEKLNVVLDVIFALPLYRHLDLDRDYAYGLLAHGVEEIPDFFGKLCDAESLEHSVFKGLLMRLQAICEDMIVFNSYVSMLLDFYFDRLKRHDAESYAVGLYDFFMNTNVQKEISSLLPDHPRFAFQQSRSAWIEYTTMPDPANPKRYMVAERIRFNGIGDFLHVDFFRALMHGAASRRCHNCGHFFLLTAGYDTRYCNNIAPGETEKTCKKIGVYRTQERKRETSIIQAEYQRTYNRLKARRQRGKLTYDEWNAAVAVAQELKAGAERGEVSEFEAKKRFEAM